MKLLEEREAKAAENSNSPTTGSQDDGRFMPPRTGSSATRTEVEAVVYVADARNRHHSSDMALDEICR
jgi:hypothetical protein